MEGPTPVSALIHAATMVTAGVYMVGRNAVLFSHAPEVMTAVAVIGALTAFMAATIGLVQTDIKRVLAYSTVSQLGYMFLASGVGAYAAGAFHLMTHAFFKALLFLGSGSVIHAMGGEQDMRRMGNLRAFMPVTYATMLMGTLAIAGIPPFSGFFSKDEILYRTFLSNKALWVLAAVTAGMTAFYMFRLMSMTFFGAYRGPAWDHGHGGTHGDAHADAAHGGHGAWHGPHESPRAMTVPLMALALGALVAGFVGIPAALGGGNRIEQFLEPSYVAHAPGAVAEGHEAAAGAVAAETAAATGGEGETHEGGHLTPAQEIGLMALSVMIAGAMIAFAFHAYVRRPGVSEALAARFAGAHRVLTNKYYVDEIYDATVVRGTILGAWASWRFDARVVDGTVNGTGWFTIFSSWASGLFDRYVVDGLVNVWAWFASEGSFAFRRLQTGLIQNYALVMLLGVFAFVSLYLFVR
jgi:NADH-quinone oxidoreductase subunit L